MPMAWKLRLQSAAWKVEVHMLAGKEEAEDEKGKVFKAPCNRFCLRPSLLI